MDTLELAPRLRHATRFLGRTPKMLINGEMVGAVSGETFEVVNPATGAVIANVPSADKVDVDLAVAAARRAFDDRVWAKVSPSEKSRMMRRIADLIRAAPAHRKLHRPMDGGAEATRRTGDRGAPQPGAWRRVCVDLQLGPAFAAGCRGSPIAPLAAGELLSGYGTFRPSRSEPWKRSRRSALGSDSGPWKPRVPMAGSHPTEPIATAIANGRYGAGRAVPADKDECRLRVQKGDDRRNAPQRARCAESGHRKKGERDLD
jgi:hypothetical protein